MAERLTFVQLVLTLYGVQQEVFLMSKKDAMRTIGVEHVSTMKRYTELGIDKGLFRSERSELDGRMEFLVVTEDGRGLIEAELAKVRRSMDRTIASSEPDDADMQKVLEKLEEQGPTITVVAPKLEELAVVADAYGGADLLMPIDKEGKPPPRTPPKTFARYIDAYGETLRVEQNNLAALRGRATKYRWSKRKGTAKCYAVCETQCRNWWPRRSDREEASGKEEIAASTRQRYPGGSLLKVR